MTRFEPDTVCVQFNAKAQAKGWPLHVDCVCDFEQPKLRELLALWQSLADNGVPPRAALDMRRLKPYARNVAILEKNTTADGHQYRFRLFGSALTMLLGEHTGRTLDETVLPEMLPGWIAFYDAVLAGRRPMRLVSYYHRPNADFLMGEIFAAPLADDAGVVRMVLSATFVDLKDYAPSPFSRIGPLA